jgi:hypothetical protein
VLDPLPPLAAFFSHSPGPYVALMLIGFGVGILGHLTRNRVLIASGIALICLGALLLPFVAGLGTNDHPPPSAEPRGDIGE